MDGRFEGQGREDSEQYNWHKLNIWRNERQ